MTELLIILGACIIGLFVGLIARNENPPKTWKPKKKNWWFQDHHWRGPLSPPMI